MIHLTLILPHGPIPFPVPPGAEVVTRPQPIMVTADGPITLPHWACRMTAITIYLSQIITAEAKADQALAEAKAHALSRLTTHITSARAALITVLPGQDMIYQAKEAEARAWIVDRAPNPADYPLLSAEVGITAPDAHQLTQLWLNMAALWRQTAATLEAQRLSVAAAIAAAETPEDVEVAGSVL